MRFVYSILFIVFYLYYDYTKSFFSIFLESLTPVERSAVSIGHKDWSLKMTRNHMNGGGKVSYLMASIRHAEYSHQLSEGWG